VPQQFGLYSMQGPYSLMAHVSPDLPGPFFRNLGSLESPHFSASVSWVTPDNPNLFNKDANVVAIMSGNTERISQASAESLGSGEGIGWRGHLDLLRDWTLGGDGAGIAANLNQHLLRLGFGTPHKELSALAAVRERLSGYDTGAELFADQGINSPLAQAHRVIVDMLKPPAKGFLETQYNELKINNPRVIALGIYRRGRPLLLEGLKSDSTPFSDWPPPSSPSIMSPETPAGIHAEPPLILPKELWMQALRRRLPLLILDAEAPLRPADARPEAAGRQ
jgi:hypothetical protein